MSGIRDAQFRELLEEEGPEKLVSEFFFLNRIRMEIIESPGNNDVRIYCKDTGRQVIGFDNKVRILVERKNPTKVTLKFDVHIDEIEFLENQLDLFNKPQQ